MTAGTEYPQGLKPFVYALLYVGVETPTPEKAVPEFRARLELGHQRPLHKSIVEVPVRALE
jgi:hypothetical protein